MPDFAYVARDQQGQRTSGIVAAASRQEALVLLGQQALFPLEVKAQAASASPLRRRIKPQRLATAYGQLADLLRSGVPLLRALEVLRRQTNHPGLQDVLDDIHAQVKDGRTLADAMQRHPKVFGEMAVSIVRAGGEGGFLEEALDRVADFTEKHEDLKSRTLGAVAYPIFLACIGLLIVTGLLVFVVPKFEGIFGRLRARGQMPALTDALLSFSQMLQSAWLPIVGTLLALGVWGRMRLSSESGRWWLDRAKLRLPLAGNIFVSLAVARFCRVLGTLLRNGVPILKSLTISSEATGNRVLGAAIRQAAENISAGQSLARPLATCRDFPPAVVEMISVAEESNTLDTVLIDVADSLERRTYRQLDLFVRLLEPLMLLLLALVVLLLAVALLLPVMRMSSSL
jgi:general secretion pathway protein F